MNRKTFKQWTIKSFDLNHFDDEINYHIQIGWDIVDGSYLISDIDGKKMISQTLLWRDENNADIKFYIEDQEITIIKKLKSDDGSFDRIVTTYHKEKFGIGYSREEIINQKIHGDFDSYISEKSYRYYDNTGNEKKHIKYNDDGYLRYLKDDIIKISGKFSNKIPSGFWSYNPIYDKKYLGICLSTDKYDDNCFKISDRTLMYRNIHISTELKNKLLKELSETDLINEEVGEYNETIKTYDKKTHKFLLISINETSSNPQSLKCIPKRYFEGEIQIQTTRYQDSDLSVDLHITDGHIFEFSFSNNYNSYNKLKKFKVKKNIDGEYYIVQDKIFYLSGILDEDEWFPLFEQKTNPETRMIKSRKIYFPNHDACGSFLKKSNTLFIEQYYTGDKDNKPTGTWYRYFPNGYVNLKMIFNDLSSTSSKIKKENSKDNITEITREYFDSRQNLQFSDKFLVKGLWCNDNNPWRAHYYGFEMIKVLEEFSDIIRNNSEYSLYGYMLNHIHFQTRVSDQLFDFLEPSSFGPVNIPIYDLIMGLGEADYDIQTKYFEKYYKHSKYGKQTRIFE
jgi:hypothetical protein